MMKKAVWETTGPVTVRYPKGTDGRYAEEQWQDICSDNAVLTVVTYGTTVNQVLEASDQLASEGISVDVIKLDCIKPVSYGLIRSSVEKTGRILIVEESAQNGCVGQDILTELICSNMNPATRLMNYGDGLVTHGDVKSLRKLRNMDTQTIYQTAKELFMHEA